MTDAQKTFALDYGRTPRLGRRSVHLLALIVAVSLICLAAARWAPPVRDRIKLLNAQRQFMAYEPGRALVVISNLAEDVDTLPRKGSAYRAERPSPAQAPAFVQFMHNSMTPAPLFLHGRKAPSGEERLVTVDLNPNGDELMLSCRSYRLASLFDAGDFASVPALAGALHIKNFATQPLRMYAGHSDANDPSAFSIRCESRGGSATIRGRLASVGSVSLSVSVPWLRARLDQGATAQPFALLAD
jgi:hypothetical protein